jgi:hypothetical protein
MRILVAAFVFAAACGSSSKKESSMVEGSDVSPTCCCKTIPETGEKEIVPNFASVGRMECSTQQGTCVDDVQCSSSVSPKGDSSSPPPASTDTGVPPPPTLGGSAAAPAVP